MQNYIISKSYLESQIIVIEKKNKTTNMEKYIEFVAFLLLTIKCINYLRSQHLNLNLLKYIGSLFLMLNFTQLIILAFSYRI